MGTLNDEILRATGGPTVQDGLRFWYASNGGAPYGAIEDMERFFLLANVASPGTNQDLWMKYMVSQGFVSGTLNDRLLAFWSAQATPVFPNLLLNSSWQGISGSVGGADFVPPTSYTIDANFTTSEAIAVPDSGGPGENGCQFVSLAGERGYFIQAGLANVPAIGQFLTTSLYIDECIEATRRLMDHPTFEGPVNIGSEEMIAINKFADGNCYFWKES